MVVIKCGGSILPKLLKPGKPSQLSKLSRGFAHFIAAWQEQGPVVLVHGGGPAIADLEWRLGLKSSFNSKGQRITNRETLQVVVQSLCGEVNSELVRLLIYGGVSAFGLSGIDGRLLSARLKDPDELGLVGEIVAVRGEILQNLCEQGLVPVVAPVSLNSALFFPESVREAEQSPILNVNADDAASAIARALHAKTMLYISDVPGIMDREGKILQKLSISQIHELLASGVIYGGMIPKVQAIIAVLQSSTVEQVLIVDGSSAALDAGPESRSKQGQILQGTCITR